MRMVIEKDVYYSGAGSSPTPVTNRSVGLADSRCLGSLTPDRARQPETFWMEIDEVWTSGLEGKLELLFSSD